MQLVIEISDDIYKALKDSEVVLNGFRSGKTFFRKVRYAIANGTPLPKGHGRLIDISEYEKNYFNVAIEYDDGDRTHSIYTSGIPTIIPADKENKENDRN